MTKRLNLHGMTFGRLVVVDCAGTDDYGAIRWRCQCSCGNVKDLRGSDLKRGFIKSCGCYNSDVAIARNTTHGQSDTRLYKTWQAMWNRVTNPNCEKFHYYGGRGITVCKEWEDFEPFYEWSMSHGYAPKLTIDRINPDGNYEPINCRWTTQLVQILNRRTPKTQKLTVEQARAIKADPRKQVVIAKEYGVSASNISSIKCGKNWARA